MELEKAEYIGTYKGAVMFPEKPVTIVKVLTNFTKNNFLRLAM
jgi:hypothetical protein